MSIQRDPLSLKLTAAPIDKHARVSHPGMAHFAGTGPDNMTCRQCLSFQHKPYSYRSKTGKYRGLIMPAPCAKYKAITGAVGAAVPDDAPACKYFTWNVAHPRRFARDA